MRAARGEQPQRRFQNALANSHLVIVPKEPISHPPALNVYAKYIYRYLDRALEMRQVFDDLLEIQAAIPILQMRRYEMLLKTLRCRYVIPTSIWFRAEYDET
jgi:hypothetical protein